VFVGCPQSICLSVDQEIYRVSVNGGTATRLTNDHLRDNDPYYSPDGKQLAWLTQITPGLPGTWDIRIGDQNGSSPHRLMNDNGVARRLALDELTQGQAGANEYPGL
jgi:Tol biopolymer transport system component